MMELADLVGTHVLDAVDFSQEKVGSAGYIEDAESMRFRLDGVVYVAVEDPEDGWRSCLGQLFVGNGVNGTAFDAQIKFVTAAGGTAFVAGDSFTVTVAAADSYTVSKSTSIDGSQNPVAILAANAKCDA